VAKRLEPDRVLFTTVLTLLTLGVVMLFSASAVYAREQLGSPYALLWRQLLWLGLGVAAMLAVLNLDYRRLRQPVAIFTAIFIVLALLVAVLFLDPARHAHRWLRWGALSLQPSELAKLVMILFLAYFLDRRRRAVNDVPSTLLPAAVLVAIFVGLVLFEPDLGTAVLLVLITGSIFFIAGVHLRYLAYLALLVLPVGYLLIVQVPYRIARIRAFLAPTTDPQGSGFQMLQSLIAVGSGGVTGVGLMDGKQKLFYLPEAHADFIFAVIGEELGLLGAAAVVVLFGIVCWRGLRVVACAPDSFARLLATGVTAMITWQALINLSVVLGLLPTKGIPLPFISYGGTSLLVTLLGTGLLLNVSQYVD